MTDIWLDGLNATFQHSVPCSSNQFSLHQTTVYCLGKEKTSILVNHIASNTSFTIGLSSSDEEINAISCNDSKIYLVCALIISLTSDNEFKIFKKLWNRKTWWQIDCYEKNWNTFESLEWYII